MLPKKSYPPDLVSRGFLHSDNEEISRNLTLAQKLQLLKSSIATERTLGARLLSSPHEPAVKELIEALKTEKKLYPKIEICHTLILLGEKSIKPLIAELGKIGNNQHQNISKKPFEKDSYPLPRDIAARTLAKMGEPVLTELLKTLESNNIPQLSEAIDAIGFICFYTNHSQVYTLLKECFSRNIPNELICWKIIRAMSGFEESKLFLSEQKTNCRSQGINREIDRSLRLIEKRK